MPPSDHLSFLSIETLYCDHHGWLFRWLRGRLGNAADAADLAQEAFLRLLERVRHIEELAHGLTSKWQRRQNEAQPRFGVAAHNRERVF